MTKQNTVSISKHFLNISFVELCFQMSGLVSVTPFHFFLNKYNGIYLFSVLF